MGKKTDLDLPSNWQINRKFYYGDYYNYWKVTRKTSDIPIDAIMMRLDYSDLKEESDWNINFLENSFKDLAQILAKNFNFLPEPLYFGRVARKNGQGSEPILLFRPIKGEQIKVYRKKNKAETYSYILSIARKVCYLLMELHKKNIIACEIPSSSITIAKTGGYSFFQFASFIAKDKYIGYNPNKEVLGPRKKYSAPECFQAKGKLSVKTDVYVMGKFLLELIMGKKEFNDFFVANPFPNKQEYESLIRKLDLSQEIKKLLLTCLALDPDYRFENVYKLLNMIKSIRRSSKKSSYHKNILVVDFGKVTKKYLFKFSRFKYFMKKKGVIFNNKKDKFCFYEFLPDGFKANIKSRGHQLEEFEPGQIKAALEKNLNSTLDKNKKLVIITDGKKGTVNYLKSILNQIDSLVYIAPENDFKSNSKVEYYNIHKFTKKKDIRI